MTRAQNPKSDSFTCKHEKYMYMYMHIVVYCNSKYIILCDCPREHVSKLIGDVGLGCRAGKTLYSYLVCSQNVKNTS